MEVLPTTAMLGCPQKLGTVVREFLGLPSKKRRKGASDRADGNEEAEKSEEKEERNSDSLGEVVVGEDEFEGLSPEEIDALAMKSASKESDTAG